MINNIDIQDEVLSEKKHKSKNKYWVSIKKIFNVSFIVLSTIFLTYNAFFITVNNSNFVTIDSKDNIYSVKDEKLPSGFFYLQFNDTKGPITVDIKKDDGTKLNYNKLSNNSIIYNESEKNNNGTRIAIIMLFNKVKSNSIYENAISEIYQYSKIHNYDLKINNMVYNKDKNIYFMKLSVILETIVEGLKENNYDWIFWVDSDVTITNPKIKLETFLPTDNEVHFIAASDRNGLNAGVFFMRVHQWSYNVLIDSLSYPYYNKGKFLRFAEQTCLNNILSENTQQNHYVIVPNSWFNRYLNSRIKGEFLIHFAGAKFKDRKSRNLRKEINNEWFDATNNEILRNEVLEYYKRPKKNQAYGGIFKELNYD